MTVAEIKKEFQQVRREQLEIEHLLAMIRNEELGLLPSGIRYDRDKVMTSPDDKFSEICAKISDMQEQLGESIYKLKKKQAYCESLIIKLEDSDEREVMRYYYLNTTCEGKLMRWDDVAICMKYDVRSIYRIHGQALANLSKVVSKCQ